MNKIIRNFVSFIVLLVLFGCNWPPRSTLLPDPNSVLRLNVQTQTMAGEPRVEGWSSRLNSDQAPFASFQV